MKIYYEPFLQIVNHNGMSSDIAFKCSNKYVDGKKKEKKAEFFISSFEQKIDNKKIKKNLLKKFLKICYKRINIYLT